LINPTDQQIADTKSKQSDFQTLASPASFVKKHYDVDNFLRVNEKEYNSLNKSDKKTIQTIVHKLGNNPN